MTTPRASTNITAEQRDLFSALTSGQYDNFALFSCFVNERPATAIVAVQWDGDGNEYVITPLFVSVTPGMVLTDHDGKPCRVEDAA
jgi:hypothetical protein